MARYFNGSTSYIAVGNSARLNLPAAGWSVGGWVKVTDNPGTVPAYVFQQRSGTPNMFGIICWGKSHATYANKFQMGYRIGASNLVVVASSGTPAANREWQHVLLIRSGADFYMYVNGEVEASGSKEGAAAWEIDVPLNFGSQEGASYFFNGHTAEWAKWDVALSPAEIASLVAGVRPIDIGPRPTWYFPFLDGIYEEINGLAVTNTDTIVSAHPPKILTAGAFNG